MISFLKTQSGGTTRRFIAKVVLASAVFASLPVLASGAQAEDSRFNDYYATFMAHTCAKLVRLNLTDNDRWSPSLSNPGTTIMGTPKDRKINFAPPGAPDWAPELFNNIWMRTHVVLKTRDALHVEAKCYISRRGNTTKSSWRPFGTATFYGSLTISERVGADLAPILTPAECGVLLDKVISENLWRPQVTASGSFQSQSRDFSGMEDFFNNTALSDSWIQPLLSPIRLSGTATKFLVTARQYTSSSPNDPGPKIAASCFVYDQVTDGLIRAGTTSRSGTLKPGLPNVR